MADFDADTPGDVEQRDRLYVDTLAQKIDAELRNPDVNWASKVDAARDPGSDFILREAVSGGGGGTSTIDADLDMNSHDITELDRLFFASNDGLETGNTQAHITSDNNGLELSYYVPTTKTHNFYAGTLNAFSLSRSLARFKVAMECQQKLTLSKEIKVGSFAAGDTAPSGADNNGSIWYDSVNNKLKAIINGVVVNLGEGGGGTTVPTPRIPTPHPQGGTWIAIKRYLHTTLSHHTAGELDSLFGGQIGRIGVLRKNTLDTGAPGELYLVFKNPTTSGITKKWLAIEFDGVLSTTQSTAGYRDDVLHYPHRQIHYLGSNRSDAHNDMIPYDDRVKGLWGIYTENDDTDDASIYVYNTGSRPVNISGTLKYKRETDELGASAPFGDVLSGTMSNILRSLEGSPHTNEGLDAAFGSDDGCVGARLPGNTNNRIYVKVGGYWFYISVTFSG